MTRRVTLLLFYLLRSPFFEKITVYLLFKSDYNIEFLLQWKSSLGAGNSEQIKKYSYDEYCDRYKSNLWPFYAEKIIRSIEGLHYCIQRKILLHLWHITFNQLYQLQNETMKI